MGTQVAKKKIKKKTISISFECLFYENMCFSKYRHLVLHFRVEIHLETKSITENDAFKHVNAYSTSNPNSNPNHFAVSIVPNNIQQNKHSTIINIQEIDF